MPLSQKDYPPSQRRLGHGGYASASPSRLTSTSRLHQERSLMAGYERFQRIMLAVATNHIGRGIQPLEGEFQEVFWNHLLDRAGPHVLERKLAADERFFTKIWH